MSGSTSLSSPPPSAPAESTSGPVGQQTSAAGTHGPSQPVTINKTINDSVLGEKTVVIKYLRYTPSAASRAKYSALQDEDVILVDVKATASAKYYDTMGADSFYLLADGTEGASTTILDSEIKTAGYPPLPDADTGKTTDRLGRVHPPARAPRSSCSATSDWRRTPRAARPSRRRTSTSR